MATNKWIEQEMTSHPLLVSRRTTIKEAWKLIKRRGFRHLPVVASGKIVGIVSERDLKPAIAVGDPTQLHVADIMTPHPYCIKKGTPLLKVVREMSRKKYGSAIVLDKENRVAGIFTRTDALRVLAEFLEKESSPDIRDLKIENYLDPCYLI